MKPIQTLLVLAGFSVATSIPAAQQSSGPTEKAEPQAQAATNHVGATSQAPASAATADAAGKSAVAANDHSPSDGGASVLAGRQSLTSTSPLAQSAGSSSNAPAGEAAANGADTLRMNFRAASLDLVLDYLSKAAGFVINVKPPTSVKGKVDIWSNDPLTREEALNLLDTVLNQNGLGAIRNGKTLTIVNRDEVKTQNIPVVQGGDPEKIPITDRVVTQIIPVRFVEVPNLVKDLLPLVSTATILTADEAGNSIVITDTQANIRKVAEIIHAIDSSAEDFTEVRLFKLKNADPTETADLLTNLFPDDTKQGNNQSPFSMNPFFSRFASRFGGGPGGGFTGGGGPGGTGGSGSNNQNQRIKKRNRVIAVADQRTASVVVSASKDLMEQIAEVVTGLDGDATGKPVVIVFKPENTDPDELKTMMTDLFNPSGTGNANRSTTQTGALQQRNTAQQQQNNSATRSSTMGQGSRGGGSAAPPSF